MKTKIRQAKIFDIPRLLERVYEFYEVLKTKGAKDIAQDVDVLRGGIAIEIGNGYVNPNWYCVIAERDKDIIAFLVGILEFCAPVSEHFKCVRVHGIYLENDSLVGPKVLFALWSLLEEWAKEYGASYFYANIHPGNQPSVRAAKKMGFKHHYTQFYRPIELEVREEL